MTPNDAAKLLALIQVYDNRNFDEMTATVWADALDELDPTDCAQAIRRHFRDSKEWLMPCDVRGGVRQLIRERAREAVLERQRRLDGAGTQPGDPATPETIRDYRQQIAEAIADIGKLPQDVAS